MLILSVSVINNIYNIYYFMILSKNWIGKTLSMSFINIFFGGGGGLERWELFIIVYEEADDHVVLEFSKWHLFIILTFSYKYKSAYHRNFCRSSVNWYQEAGSLHCDGDCLVLPERSSCNSFCHRKGPIKKNPQGSSHFLRAKQHWLNMDNKSRLISNNICIRNVILSFLIYTFYYISQYKFNERNLYYKCDHAVNRIFY